MKRDNQSTYTLMKIVAKCNKLAGDKLACLSFAALKRQKMRTACRAGEV